MPDKAIAKLKYHLPSVPFIAALAAVLIVIAAGFVYFGAYNVAADEPHTPLVYSLLDNVRHRSIAVRASDIVPPVDLDTPARIATGAGPYAEMCSGCHLGPGVEKSEMSQGLYPQAPELAKIERHDPAKTFWIIKHGVKMSAMPAWGKTHPDPLMWDMVAFVRKLPSLTPGQYRQLVASAPGDHAEIMGKMPNMK